jgi:hypothetical protein
LTKAKIYGTDSNVKSQLTTPSAEAKEGVRQLLPELPAYIEIELQKLQDDTGFGQRLLTSEEKATVCRLYTMYGSVSRCAEEINCSPATLYRHMELDPDFRSAFALAKLSLGDRVQTKSVERALTNNGVVDRMCQLKRFFPNVYRESQGPVQVGVAVNLGIAPPA